MKQQICKNLKYLKSLLENRIETELTLRKRKEQMEITDFYATDYLFKPVVDADE